MRKFVLMILMMLWAICPIGTSQSIALEPTDSWVYRSLELLNHYIAPDYFANQRPFARDVVERYLDSNHWRSAKNPVVGWESQRLRQEYDTRPTISDYAEAKIPLWLKISPYSINQYIEKNEPLYRIGFKAETTIDYARQFFFQLRGRLENKGNLDSFAKVRRWKDKLTGYFDYALLGYRFRSIRLTWGRTFRAWGPHDNDRLLLSTNSPAFNQISFEFTHKWFAFQYWTTRLDDFYTQDSAKINRFYAAHRLAFKPCRKLEIGLSETVLYGRVGSGWELQYLNPLVPFYWEQYNNGGDDNIYMGADFSWYPWPGIYLYGELLIDDFQIDFVSEPQQVGFNLGFSELGRLFSPYLQITADYTQIRNTVYGQNRFYNVYANNGVVIGSSLGNDTDRWRYGLSYHFSQYITASVGGRFERQGEGRYNLPQNPAVPKHQKFPSGRVEKDYDHYLKVEFMRGGVIEGAMTIGYLSITNQNNLEKDYHSPYFSLNILVHLRKSLLL